MLAEPGSPVPRPLTCGSIENADWNLLTYGISAFRVGLTRWLILKIRQRTSAAVEEGLAEFPESRETRSSRWMTFAQGVAIAERALPRAGCVA